MRFQDHFQLGPWQVYPHRNALVRGPTVVHLEPKVMQVLLRLAQHPGAVVTREELIADVWLGTTVNDEVATRAISALRKALEDNPRNPTFIETRPKKGYRLLPPIVLPAEALFRNGQETAPAFKPSASSPRSTPFFPEKRTWGVVAVVVVLAISGVAGYRLSNPTSTGEPAAFRHLPLTTLPGAEFDPAFSPTSNQLAFVWTGGPEVEDRYDIYIKDLGTDEIRPLTEGEGRNFGPAWSPDGRHLAYIRSGEAGCEIMTVAARGGAKQKLAGCGDNFMADVAWSPDEKHLLYSDRPKGGAPYHIMRLSLETHEKTVLTKPEGSTWGDIWGDTSPAFSPDGRQVAFIRWQNRTMQDVYVAPASGGPARRLTHRDAPVEGLAWTPDGRAVIFSTSDDENFGLWRVSVEGGAPERMHLGNTGLRNPNFASDAERLVGEHWIFDINLWRLPLDHAAQPAGAPEVLTGSTRRDTDPHFSPDGMRLAFTSNRTGSNEVWIANRDGNAPVQLTALDASFTGIPRWSPDGDRLAFESQAEGASDLYVTDISGSWPKRLTADAGMNVGPRWSRDGRWIYFGSDRSGQWQVWKIPAEGGPAIQVTQDGGMAAEESPDGQWLYFTRADEAGIWRSPLQGGAMEHMTDLLDAHLWGQWTVTEKGIFLMHQIDHRVQLLFLSLVDGAVTPLVTSNFHGGLTLSPDGSSLLYSQIDRRESDIMLVEGVR